MLTTFCSLIGTPVADLPPCQRLQIELPVKSGGFGLRSKRGTMNAAYLSAFLTAQCVIQQKWGPQLGDIVRNITDCGLPTAMDVRQAYIDVLGFDESRGLPDEGRARRLLSAVLPNGLVNLPAVPGPLAGMQHRLTELIDAVNRIRALDLATVEERAWLESNSGPCAGAFLPACPGIIAPTTRMNSREFATACQRRLYLPIPELRLTDAVRGVCPILHAPGGRACTRSCDVRGAHLTTCPTGSGPTAVHDAVNAALAIYGFQQVFPPALVLFQRDAIRVALLQRLGLPFDAQLDFPVPDIMTLGEETMIVDTRLTDPRCATSLARGSGGAKGAGRAAENATAAKLLAYAPAFAAGYLQAADFHPFVVEHGGRLSKSASALLHRLARLHEAKLTNLPPREKLGPAGNRFLTMLRRVISSTLQKASSRLVNAVHDRVIFTRARDTDISDFHALQASDIAEAVGGFG